MTLIYEEVDALPLDFAPEELAERVIRHTLEAEACPYEAEVNLLLTSEAEVQVINQQFRDLDKTTDVLSFPTIAYDLPADFRIAEDQPLEAFNPESGELMLGDVVIASERVISQAESYGHSQQREFAFLVVHSILHLLGYDHMEEDDRKTMEEKQANILAALEIFR